MDVLDVIDTEEYREYARMFRSRVVFDMIANAPSVTQKSGVYTLGNLTFDECLSLIKDSIAAKKNLLLESIKANKVDYDPAMVY
jgi:hypothetical protein